MRKSRIAYSILLVAIIIFYIVYPDYLSFIALVFTLLLPAVLFLFTVASVSKVHAAITAEVPATSSDEAVGFQVRIKNESALPLARVKLHFIYQNLLSGEQKAETLCLPVDAHSLQTLKWSVTSPCCGKVVLRIDKLVLYDFFCLFGFAKRCNASVRVLSLPTPLVIDAKVDLSNAADLDSDTYSKVKPGSDSSETFGIREYMPGDSPRSIHWKLSSKLDRLMVRQFSLPIPNSIFLLTELMLGDATQTFSPAVMNAILVLTCTFSQFLAENSIRHRVFWQDSSLKSLENQEVETPLELVPLLSRILEAEPYSDAPRTLEYYTKVEHARCSLLLYITPYFSQEVLAELEKAHRGAQVLVCHVQEEPQQPPETPSGITVLSLQPSSLRQQLDGLVL